MESAFSLAGFLSFPEHVVGLVPGRVPLSGVRHLLALFAVLPATFVAWDILFIMVGRWSLAAADGPMGLA